MSLCARGFSSTRPIRMTSGRSTSCRMSSLSVPARRSLLSWPAYDSESFNAVRSGVLELAKRELPRDREGSFEPQLVPKHQRRFAGFDDKIVSMYARGMSTREISKHLEEIYGVEVGRDTISRVTDAVLDDVKEWQARPLEKLYLVVWLDALVLKIRDQGSVRNKHAYLAIGVGIDGIKETLGIWLEPNEGAKFWLRVISELKSRGVEDILVFSVDGLKGFPEAIEAVYPQAIVQTCIVHMIRNSLRFTSYKDRDQLVKDLRMIYTAASEEAAQAGLETFTGIWDSRYPQIRQS